VPAAWARSTARKIPASIAPLPIKILPTHLSDNPEFKQRFEREARTVSSLNHPHICHLHDVGSQDGTDFLVMEFLDGETLAERLRRGALLFPELLKIGMEVAEALETAHRAGIVHRDLKPGNIMLTKSGTKLMDFGLAKPASLGAAGSGSAPLLSAARTMSGPTPVSPLTTAGSIVGTIQYMSPEQIEGKEADARSDIFAFGAVLYEMATGKRAFEGKSQISVASAILEKDPDPISASKPSTPPPFDYLVAACLAKDREDRFQSAHDVRLQLKGISQSPQGPVAVTPAQSPRTFLPRALLAAAVPLLLVAAGMIFYLSQRANPPALSVRAYIPPPPQTTFRASGFDAGPVVVAPDGKTLAFSAVDDKGRTNLWLRPLDAQQATMLPSTEDAATPFWSPDSHYLAFVADRKLKTISVSGGDAQTLTGDDSVYSGCGDWSPNGIILFCKQNFGPISQIAASGGPVSPATRLNKDEIDNSAPSFLPDGKHFLYVSGQLSQPARIKLGVLGKPEQDGIDIAPGSHVAFASGHLLFVRAGRILAQSFDPRTFKLSGDPQTIGEARTFSVSQNGVLAYHESSAQSELKLFDRSGNLIGTPGPQAVYSDPRFSPDGKSIAVTIEDPRSGKDDIWVLPVAGGQPTRITFGPENYWPVWSPDGKQIAYGVREDGKLSIRRRSLDGRQPEEVLYQNDAYINGSAIDWSPDGKYLSIDLESKEGIFSNWILPLTGDRKVFQPPAASHMTASEYDGRFSPDIRWLAYFSYETGRPEVYVVPFEAGAKTQVSTTGGWNTMFSRDHELFFVSMGNRLMAAHTSTQANFHVDSIEPLFQLDLPNFTGISFDVSSDAKQFVVQTTDHTKSTSITLLTNWPAELKK
jgi:serine/threonine protein kinase